MKRIIIFQTIICISLFYFQNAFAGEANDIKTLVSGNSEFAFNLYHKLKGDSNSPKNLFFSPFSISTALAMTYGGARGETQKQMAEVLHFNLSNEKLFAAFGDLQKTLIQKDKSIGYQLVLANALWKQQGEAFLKEFLDLNQNYYGAYLKELDFVNETEPSRQTINSWVEEKTNNKIKNFIPPNMINKDTAMVITNAIFFKGEWEKKFNPRFTQKSDFFVSSEKKVKVDMMHLKEGLNVYADNVFKAVELPYKGRQISMLIILPKIKTISDVEKTFNLENFNNLLSKQIEITPTIDLFLPKFKMDQDSFSLNKVLAELGMYNAFKSGKADFSGINAQKDLFISEIFHKAFIEVNEKGTEAAAASGDLIAHDVPIVFRVDHPFIFLIKDNRTQSILFMGRVVNPNEI